MKIQIAKSDKEVMACYPVMQELRPLVEESQFLSRIRDQEKSGYKLVFVRDSDDVVAVAGFRVLESMSSGRFLYVDDLVTAAEHRSKGIGTKLLAWLKDQAAADNCSQLQLDSGLQRKATHRFYEREGVPLVGFHFACNLTSDYETRET